VLASCHCAQINEQLTYRCGQAGECEPGRVCDGTWCVPMANAGGSATSGGGGGASGGSAGGACTPTKRCDADDCGSIGDDGCGAMLDCGGCVFPAVCGALEPNKCACVRADAGSQVCPQPVAGQTACGTRTIDNCGTFETFTCGGACPAGSPCVENICCSPPTEAELCASALFECGRGEVIDRCGTRRFIGCGGCGAGEQCIAVEHGSACVTTMASCVPENEFEFCEARGANCGAVSGMDRCGAMRMNVVCGGACDAGGCSSTTPNQCTCQPALSGCSVAAHCCGGLECGRAGLCCAGNQQPCDDDAFCCGGNTFCQQGRCCNGPGVACTSGTECCSGRCLADGGCDAVDAGNTWDGGEL